MKSTRWTLEQILAIGNVYGSDSDSDDDDQGGGGTGGTGQPNVDDKSGGTGGSGDSDDDGDDPEVLKRKLKNKREEQDRQFQKLKDAERERDELRAKQEEQDRKGKTELENAKTDLENEKAKTEKLTDTVRRLTIENAFMGLKDIDWHNPARALALVDLSEVEFDEVTGRVKDPKAVAKAAKKLADDEPYLVKSKTAPPPGTPAGKATGKPPAVGGKVQGKTDEELLKHYNVRR